MTERSPITTKGFAQLKALLKHLKTVERPKIVQAIAEARAHGDLSENAEYDAAKEAQGMLEAKIRMIEGRVSSAQVVDVSSLGGEKVIFGATVCILDLDSDEEKSWTIVGEDEANVDKGFLAYNTPIAKGLIGKSEGDVAEITLPGGKREFEIVSVEFSEPEVEISLP